MALNEMTRIVNKAVAIASRKGKVTRAALEGSGYDPKSVTRALKDGVIAGVLRKGGATRGTFYTVPEAK